MISCIVSTISSYYLLGACVLELLPFIAHVVHGLCEQGERGLLLLLHMFLFRLLPSSRCHLPECYTLSSAWRLVPKTKKNVFKIVNLTRNKKVTILYCSLPSSKMTTFESACNTSPNQTELTVVKWWWTHNDGAPSSGRWQPCYLSFIDWFCNKGGWVVKVVISPWKCNKNVIFYLLESALLSK